MGYVLSGSPRLKSTQSPTHNNTKCVLRGEYTTDPATATHCECLEHAEELKTAIEKIERRTVTVILNK